MALQVTLITLLIITGLVIDLGGGPNHERLGFRVSIEQLLCTEAVINCHESTVLEKSWAHRSCGANRSCVNHKHNVRRIVPYFLASGSLRSKPQHGKLFSASLAVFVPNSWLIDFNCQRNSDHPDKLRQWTRHYFDCVQHDHRYYADETGT